MSVFEYPYSLSPLTKTWALPTGTASILFHGPDANNQWGWVWTPKGDGFTVANQRVLVSYEEAKAELAAAILKYRPETSRSPEVSL